MAAALVVQMVINWNREHFALRGRGLAVVMTKTFT